MSWVTINQAVEMTCLTKSCLEQRVYRYKRLGFDISQIIKPISKHKFLYNLEIISNRPIIDNNEIFCTENELAELVFYIEDNNIYKPSLAKKMGCSVSNIYALCYKRVMKRSLLKCYWSKIEELRREDEKAI